MMVLFQLMSFTICLQSANSTETQFLTERKHSCFHSNIHGCRVETWGRYCCSWGQWAKTCTYTPVQITLSHKQTHTHPLLSFPVCVAGMNLQPHVQLQLPGSHFAITPMAPSTDRTVPVAFFFLGPGPRVSQHKSGFSILRLPSICCRLRPCERCFKSLLNMGDNISQ